MSRLFVVPCALLAGPLSGPVIWVIPGPLGLLARWCAINDSPGVSGRVRFRLEAGSGGNVPFSFSLMDTPRGGGHSKTLRTVGFASFATVPFRCRTNVVVGGFSLIDF